MIKIGIKIMAVLSALAALLSSENVQAQPKTDLRPDETVFLYSKDAGDLADPVVGKKISYAGFRMEEANGLTGAEELKPSGNLGNISGHARVDLYFPKKGTGQMVVVCPGGGYAYVSSYNEGVYVAEWMLEHGIAVAVVKYRMPNGHWEVPLADVQNAFRYCRSHADEWKITSLGVMGFSAGGHLAATTSVMYCDAATRPDFSVLIYPVITMEMGITHKGTRFNLVGNDGFWTARGEMAWGDWNEKQAQQESLLQRYSLENQATADTPKTFLALSGDDGTVPPENSLRYYRALIAHGVPAEMHIFPSGGHGWGFTTLRYAKSDKIDYAREDFESCLARWLVSVR